MATALKRRGRASRIMVSAEEWAMRVDLAAAYRLVALYGWDDLIFTHLSARVPGPEHHFLINPYDMMFEEITASSLVKIDVEGKPVMDTPHPVNPAGFTIHSAIHMARARRARGDASAHAARPGGIGDGIRAAAAHPDRDDRRRTMSPITTIEGIATDLDERERLVEDLGDKNAMILRNHGTLTVGATVAAGFLRLYFLERACEAQVADAVGRARQSQQSRRRARRKRCERQTSARRAWRMVAGAAGLAGAAAQARPDRSELPGLTRSFPAGADPAGPAGTRGCER